MSFMKKMFRKPTEAIPLTGKRVLFRWESFIRWGGIVSLCLFLSLSLATGIFKQKDALEIGDISAHDIKAPRTFPVVNRAATLKEERKAVSKVHRVYVLDAVPLEYALKTVSALIDNLERIDTSVDLFQSEMGINEQEEALVRKKPVSKEPLLKHNGIVARIERFRASMKLNLSDRDLETLFFYASAENYQVMESIEDVLSASFTQIFRNGVIKDKAELIDAIKPKTSIHLKQGEEIDENLQEVSRFHSLAEALKSNRERIEKQLATKDKALISALINLSKILIRPNLRYDLMATKILREEAHAAVSPVMMTIKQGKMIVREGEQVTEEQHYLLKALSSFQTRTTIKVIMGRSLWIVFLVMIGLVYLRKFYPHIYNNSSRLLLLGLITFFLVPIARVMMAFNISIYLLPLAVCPILIAIIFEPGLALSASFLLIGVLAPALKPPVPFMVYSLVAVFIANINTSQLRKRDDLSKAGLILGVANVVTVLLIPLFTDAEFFTQSTMNNSLFALTNGLLVYFITSGLLPIFEGLFNITTDIKLIELSDLNRPILRRMALEAPGTYHHSIIVGNLAEAAAEGVAANPLLARVASYYHDIGKIDKREYFSENNSDSSKHTLLSPNMSSLILISHVKEGVELARKNKLPERIINIIRQHHGTTLVSFFYQKALKDDEHNTIKRDDFRYPGPKPQSREAAIIMLADSVEATSRSLTKITSSNIRKLIRKTIQTKLEDKQLDESELTLKDLRIIASTFERILNAIFHTRIEYPQDGELEVKKGGKGAKWA